MGSPIVPSQSQAGTLGSKAPMLGARAVPFIIKHAPGGDPSPRSSRTATTGALHVNTQHEPHVLTNHSLNDSSIYQAPCVTEPLKSRSVAYFNNLTLPYPCTLPGTNLDHPCIYCIYRTLPAGGVVKSHRRMPGCISTLHFNSLYFINNLFFLLT